MVLVPIREWLVHLLKLLELLLCDFIVIQDLDVVLGDTLNLALLVLAQVLRGELVDWVIKDKNLVALVGILLEDWASENGVFRVTRKIQNSVLVVLHAADVLIKREESVWVVSGLESTSNIGKTSLYQGQRNMGVVNAVIRQNEISFLSPV